MTEPGARSANFNWNVLQAQSPDLAALDAPFTGEEVCKAIATSQMNKAPGPDGYTGLFFKQCWTIIKQDIMAAVHSLQNSRCRHLNLLNKTNIILLPKKDEAEDIKDFRPISLIHGVAKILTKILALRLAPYMNDLISPCQSAFIKGRSIHDNFMYVRNIARRFHRTKTPTPDKARHIKGLRFCAMGLPARLASTERFPSYMERLGGLHPCHIDITNYAPLDPIQHGMGLRQGDPLSPLLFILAIDPLQRLLSTTTDQGLLSKLNGRVARLRVSMYADDAIIFLKPTKRDVANLKDLLARFGQVTGLSTNIQKTSITPITCDGMDLDDILSDFPATRLSFPIKYLGLPLTV